MASTHIPVLELQLSSVAVVRPGDKLVICLDRQLSMAEFVDAREYFEHQLPGVDVVLAEGKQMVVYRNDDS